MLGEWMMYQYIAIQMVAQSSSGKTGTWRVYNKKSQCCLGEISWYAAWRQYVFTPRPGTCFSTGCLEDVIDFVDNHTKITTEES